MRQNALDTLEQDSPLRRCPFTEVPADARAAGIAPARSAIPTLPGLPVLGSVLDFRSRRLELLRAAATTYRDVCQIKLAGRPFLLVNSAELAHAILVQQPAVFEKGAVWHELLATLLGAGLLTVEGDEHRRQRKLMMPVFAAQRFAAYAPQIADEIARATVTWGSQTEVDLAAESVKLTLSVTLRTVLGVEQKQHVDEIGNAMDEALRAIERSVTGIVLIPLGWPTPNNRRRRRAIERLDRIVASIIAERRRSGRDDGSLLARMLQARDDETGTGLSDRQIRDQVVTMLAAGNDTMATSLAWSWYLILRHPEVAERVYAEADALPADGVADGAALAYTTQVLKEAMRLYSPSYLHERRSLRPTAIGPYELPANTTVLINAWGIHYRPDYYPDPERFLPERFAPAAERARHKGAYLPMGLGPRICIGNALGFYSGPRMLALLAKRFRFTQLSSAPIAPRPSMTVKPERGVLARVERIGRP
jgi:cytochrome P450